jgi:hypothetical protein
MKSIFRPIIFPLSFLFLSSLGAAGVEPAFHVAPFPRGNDAHDGSAAKPFATLERARLAVRAHLAAHELRSNLVVELQAGTYELAAPVRFEATDSGENGFAVIYRSAPDAEVVLSGGRRVLGWAQESDGLYRADVGPNIDFRQLWINGRRAVRAREPHVGRMFTLAADKQENGFDLPRAQLAGIELRPAEIEVSVLIAWMHKRLRIARLADTDDPDIIRAVIESGEWDGVTKQPQGDRVYLNRSYWLENAREFLDAPGEFFLDRTGGTLRYVVRPGENPAAAVFIRPELESLIVLAGTIDAPVHDLHFEGLTFAHTGWTRPNQHGFVDVQANSLIPADLSAAADPQYRHNQRKDRIPAAFQAFTSDRIVVRACRFVHLGGTGVMFTHGGDDNVIEGNSFFDVAAGGIELGDDAARPTNPRLFPRRNRIANNFLAHIGEDYFGSVAILGYYTDGSLITHNEIAAIPYTAVSQGWGWGNPPAPADSRAIRITHNRVTNYMRRLDDGGGLYTTDRMLGSEISHNVIEHMLPPDVHTKAGGALYLDQFTEGVHVHHNVVIRGIRWLNLWNPNIRGNRIETNYADTSAHRNDAPDNQVEPVNLITADGHAAAAQAIRSAAGIEPAFARAREFAVAPDVIVESTSVAFQPVSGTWTPVAPAGRYGAHCMQSTDPDAVARWSPALPRDGEYELSVWRPPGSAGATYVVRRAGRDSTITLTPGGNAGWESLGRFSFQAGATTEVIVTPPAASPQEPILVDSLRFTLQAR